MICKLKLHSKGFYWKNLRALHALKDLEPRFKFPIHLFVGKSWENYRQTYGKSKASLSRNLSTGTPAKHFRTILWFVALVYNWYFFQNSRLWKLFNIRFSYKHCNFSHVCLLVKMASKTVTRSIILISLIDFVHHFILLFISLFVFLSPTGESPHFSIRLTP